VPIFSFKALNPDNTVSQGSLNAESREEVASILTKKSLTPLSIQELSENNHSKKSLPEVEKMNLCRYLGTMLKSGLAISESIEVLLEESEHPLTKKVLSDLSYSLNHGQSLSAVFARYPNSFDNFFVTIIRSGEISGTLAESFYQLEEKIAAEHSLKQTITGTLMYPAVVCVAMLGMGVLMLFFILPQIGKVFLNMHVPLNSVTVTLFNTAMYAGKNKVVLLPSLFIALIGLGIFFNTRLGKQLLMHLISPVPAIRNLVKQMDIARFCRTFSTLLSTGVPITEALEIALDSMSYTGFRRLSKDIIDQVTTGKTLSIAFKNTKIFPPLLTQMILSGEKSGTLDTSLKDLGMFYEEEVTVSIKKATQILEPLIMLVVGIGVGAMVLAVIGPVYSIIGSLQAGQH